MLNRIRTVRHESRRSSPKYFRRGKDSNLHRTIERTAQRTTIGKTVAGCRNEEDREAGIPRRNSVAPVLRFSASPLLRFSAPCRRGDQDRFLFPAYTVSMKEARSHLHRDAIVCLHRRRRLEKTRRPGKRRGERQGKGSKRRV